MGRFTSPMTNQAFFVVSVYIVMLILMTGSMLGLVVWSSWISTHRGVISTPKSHYDYIVVGGGTAGCVLATRLSADPHNSVLLIEAGDHFNWLSTIPLATPILQGSANDWAFRTKPQIHSSWGLNNQSSAWPRGRGLGGSGQLNYLLHYAGSEEDFSRWEKSGATGWGLRQLQPYISKMLGIQYNCSTCTQPCVNNYQNLLMSVVDQNSTCNLQQTSHEECQSAKISTPTMHISQVDINKSVLGQAFMEVSMELKLIYGNLKFSPAQSTVFKGQRWSSLNGYLRPILGRSNLHVLLNNHVTKVVIDDMRRVQGVELKGVADQSSTFVRSQQEVILSAGAVNTPLILLRSGIGPQTQLHKYGIPVMSDLHVGYNLHDHLNLPLYVSLQSPVSVTLDKVERLHQFWDYMIHGTGLLASSAIIGVGTAESELGLMLFGLGSADEKLLRDVANYKQETFRALFPFSDNKTQEGFVLLASCLLPTSRGTVSLKNVHPFGEPVIDPQYLQNPHDIDCMVRAVQLAIRVSASEPFKKLGAKLHLPQLEECQHLETDPDNVPYLECIIHTAAITGYHPGGTCKMGSPYDEAAVVDPLLRVRGLQGLRIMDASIMPTPVSGHPNSILIAMAEHAANLVLEN